MAKVTRKSKSSKRTWLKTVVLLLLFTIILTIIFYPVEERASFNGKWDIDHIYIGEKDIVQDTPKSKDLFGADIPNVCHLVIRGNSCTLHLNTKEVAKGHLRFPHKDTVVINSQSAEYNSRYFVHIDTINSFSDVFDVQVTLTSKDKSIKMHMNDIFAERQRMMREYNNKPVRRGRP